MCRIGVSSIIYPAQGLKYSYINDIINMIIY